MSRERLSSSGAEGAGRDRSSDFEDPGAFRDAPKDVGHSAAQESNPDPEPANEASQLIDDLGLDLTPGQDGDLNTLDISRETTTAFSL